MIRMPGLAQFVVVGLIFFGGVTVARGAASSWTDTGGGLWNDPTNWSAGVATTTATFDLSGTYTVTFDVSPTISLIDMQNGTVTFALAGHTLTTTNNASGIGIANDGQTARLTVLNGTVVSGGNNIGANSIDTGILTISTGAVFSESGSSFQIGASGNGTVTVNNGGQLSSVNTTIATNATGFGAATVTGSGSQWAITSGSVVVGNNGSGSLTVSSGGSVVVPNSTMNLGSGSTGSGSATVTGSASLLDVGTNLLRIGDAGQARMTISSGGTVNSGASTLANSSGSSGDVTITGAGSSWNTSGQLNVGLNGAGTLTITNGGALNSNSGSTTVLGNSGGSGSVSLTGNGSTWTAKQNITVGGAGMGNLTIDSGAALSMTGSLTVTAGTGTMTMNGGTVDVGATFFRGGAFNFNDGTLIVRGSYANTSSLAAPLVIEGDSSAALPTLELIGNASTLQITALTVGNSRRGALVLSDGRSLSVSSNPIAIGASAGSSGSITLSGPGTQLTTTSTTTVGGIGASTGGTGVLTIGSGAGLSTGTLNIFAGGTLNLNGGTVFTTLFSSIGGTFNFNSGTLAFSGTAGLNGSQLDTILGAGHLVGLGRSISTVQSLSTTAPWTISGGAVAPGTTYTNSSGLDVTAGSLIVGTTLTNNAPLTISGGSATANALTNASSLLVSGGSLAVNTTLTNNAGQLLQIASTGLVTATSGIANNGTIQLSGNLVPTAGGLLTNSGTIRGTGFVGNNFTNTAAGQVQLTTGNRLEFQGGTITNSGLISLTGGELVFTGSLTNSANTGLISGRDAILRSGGSGIVNNGSLAFTAGTMDVYGDITNNIGGLITGSGGGTTTFYDDVMIAPGAANVRATAVGGTVSKVVFFGSYNGGIAGGGTAFIEGDHRPGNSPGVVTFGGDLAYGGLATLHVEIGGTTPGTGPGHHDQVNVAGVAALDGTLDLAPFGGFVPISGDKFVVMTYASASGAFASVTGTTPAVGLTYTPVYSPTNLTILTTTTGEKTWAVDSSGDASVGANWTGGIAPGGIGDSATFSTIITAPRVVTLDADTTVGTLKLDSPVSYTIAGPHTLTLQAPGATAATINVLNTHGNGVHAIGASLTLASNLNIVQNSGGTFRLTGPLNDSAARTVTKTGLGTVEIAAQPTLGAGTMVNVSAGTLRFAATSGSPTLGAGAQVNVSGSSTLELAGSVSALASSANRVRIVNDSAAAAGLLVSGTNQQVGPIDGLGTTQANAGSDLTANHILQGALAIGGAPGSPALVTIAASDASGNPFGQSGAPASEGSLPSAEFSSRESAVTFFGTGSGGASSLAGDSLADRPTTGISSIGGIAAVPEPPTALLLTLGVVTCLAFRRRTRRQAMD